MTNTKEECSEMYIDFLEERLKVLEEVIKKQERLILLLEDRETRGCPKGGKHSW